MPTPLPRVKSITTSSEFALVRASRTPAIHRLSETELRDHARRARGLFDKWQDLSRAQGRRRTGSGKKSAPGNRTAEKVKVFREALDAFEKRLAEGAGSDRRAPAPGLKPRHGAERAATRAKLSKLKAAHNTETRAARSKSRKPDRSEPVEAPPAKPAPAESPAPAAKPKGKPVKKKAWQLPALLASPAGAQRFNVAPTRQLSARTQEKRSRIAESGLRSRVRGHVMVSGKRKQARRDARR